MNKNDYAKIYEEFYSKYYTKFESSIKAYFIKCKKADKSFGIAIYAVKIYIQEKVLDKHMILRNESLKNLHLIFIGRCSNYENNQVQNIFTIQIKREYNKIDKNKLPADYDYLKLIEDFASFEVATEILRLLTQNSRLLDMIYKANYFDEFEINEHQGYLLEQYPLYQKINLLLNPMREKLQIQIIKNKSELKMEAEADDKNIASELFINSKVSSCFLDYHKKHILNFHIDYSYLKKRMEDEKLIYKHTDNDFMKIIFKKLQLINQYNYDEYLAQGKLNSLHKSYSVNRQNNFNIVFAAVLDN